MSQISEPLKSPRIYIVFSMGSNIAARMIARWTNSDISHAFLAWWASEFDTVLTLGAQFNGLTVETLDSFIADGNTVRYIFTAPGLWVGARKHAGLIDSSYDYAGLLGMGWVEAWWRLRKRWVSNPLTSKRSLFCSAYALLIIRDSGYDSVLSLLQPSQVSPQRLLTALKVAPEPWRTATEAEMRSNSVFGFGRPIER